ncbi:MAG TPA: glycosyltransferase family 39 protein, partial [Planctomycetota bacterium]|nr:glycosyltransferase family 39 protein [Planctomycetota bacterium]
MLLTSMGVMMDKSQRLDVVVVAALMLLVALVTVPFLGRGGFWFDEIFSVTTASSWTRLGEVFSRYENNMALYYVLLHGWMGLGDDEWTVRLLSTLCALATLPLLHVLACQLWNRRVAFITDILLVTSTLFLHHAMEARAYSLLLFFAVFSSLLFLQALRRPGWGWWIAYAVVAALSSYAHYFGILMPVAHAMSLAWRERGTIPWRQVLVSTSVIAVLLIPQALFHPPSMAQLDWLDRPDVQAVVNVGTTFAGGRSRLLLYGLAMGLTLVFVRRVAAQSSERSWALWFMICWLVVPVAAALAASLLVKPVFLPKYLIGSLPA